MHNIIWLFTYYLACANASNYATHTYKNLRKIYQLYVILTLIFYSLFFILEFQILFKFQSIDLSFKLPLFQYYLFFYWKGIFKVQFFIILHFTLILFFEKKYKSRIRTLRCYSGVGTGLSSTLPSNECRSNLYGWFGPRNLRCPI
jgi:hypothetical protein